MKARSFPRESNLFFRFSLIALVIVGAELAYTLLVRSDGLRSALADVFATGVDVLATAALVVAARRISTRSKRLGGAWGLIAASMLCITIADGGWAVLELVLHAAPFPSFADAFYLASYPLLLAGVLLLLGRSLNRREQAYRALDIAVLLLAGSLFFWNFLVAPSVAANPGDTRLEQLVLLAYPVGDVVLFGALLLIVGDRSVDLRTDTLLCLAAYLVLTIVPDCIYSYQTLTETYVSGGLVDIGWDASTLLLGLAAVSVIAAEAGRGQPAGTATGTGLIQKMRPVFPYVPYVGIIAAYLVLVDAALRPLPMSFATMSIAVGAILGLLLVRQALTLAENARLNATLKTTNVQLKAEIKEHHRVEEQLSYDALHDPLTGLANHTLFLDRVGVAMEHVKRGNAGVFAILFIDLDGFKAINDSLGHLLGDQLLLQVSRRLQATLRSSDTISRFGGDEFEILLDNIGDRETAGMLAGRVREALLVPFRLNGQDMFLTASIGVVLGSSGYGSPTEMLRDADIAMYEAKVLGKDRYAIFDLRMRRQAFSRLELENEIRQGLERREFRLFYQPILQLENNRLVGFEALIRWMHPKRGLLPPGEFLPLAEESGLIIPLGDWVLNEACAQLRAWRETLPELHDATMSINVSGRQFATPGFVDRILRALDANRLKPDSLKLEFTERVVIGNYAVASEVFARLRTLGVESHIDDFGTGYSALAYLQRFPIDGVKIDSGFVREMGRGYKGTELVRAVVSMARELGMHAIAEGIETQEQLEQLKDLSCDYGQGFLLSEPVAAEAVGSLVERLLKEAHHP